MITKLRHKKSHKIVLPVLWAMHSNIFYPIMFQLKKERKGKISESYPTTFISQFTNGL